MKPDQKSVVPLNIEGKIDTDNFCTTSCPFLATEFDEMTPMAFAHQSNRCYRHGAPMARQLHFQKVFCLSEAYEKCQIYREPKQNHKKIIANHKNTAENRGSKVLGSTVIVLILFLTLISWLFLNQFPIQSAAHDSPASFNKLQIAIQELSKNSAEWAQITLWGQKGQQKHKQAIDNSASKPIHAAKNTRQDSSLSAFTVGGSFRAVPYATK